jgi:DNA-binding MarR family transcriptional regulator
LGVRLAIHQSTCSQLVEKLAVRGLILKERSREDQRRIGLSLSEAASELLAKAPGPAQGVLPEALVGLSDEALRALDASLALVIGRLRIRDDKFADNPLADLS